MHPLRVERIACGLKQTDLAHISGVSVRTIGSIEMRAEGYRPRRDTCKKLVAALGFPPDYWRTLFPEWGEIENSDATSS